MTKEMVMGVEETLPIYSTHGFVPIYLCVITDTTTPGCLDMAPNDKDGESLPYIVQALLDVKPCEEVFAGRRHQWSGNNSSSSGSVNRKPRGKARKGRKSKK